MSTPSEHVQDMSGEENYFQLPDGRRISIETGRRVHATDMEDMVQVPTNQEAQALVTHARRKLVDLPDVPQRMNVISIVLTYTMFGLDDDEIAVALGIEKRRVAAIKMLDAYTEMQNAVSDNIKNSDLDPVNRLIEQHTESAVSRVVTIMNQGDTDSTKLAAARDLLDRSGRRPADVHEHRVMHSGGLVIEHIERSEHAGIEEIDAALDADFTDITDTPQQEDT